MLPLSPRVAAPLGYDKGSGMALGTGLLSKSSTPIQPFVGPMFFNVITLLKCCTEGAEVFAGQMPDPADMKPCESVFEAMKFTPWALEKESWNDGPNDCGLVLIQDVEKMMSLTPAFRIPRTGPPKFASLQMSIPKRTPKCESKVTTSGGSISAQGSISGVKLLSAKCALWYLARRLPSRPNAAMLLNLPRPVVRSQGKLLLLKGFLCVEQGP